MWKSKGKTIRFMLYVVLGILINSPILYALSLSFVPDHLINSYPPKLLPQGMSLVNYEMVFKSIPIITFILNSLFVALLIVVAQVITSSLAAFAFTYLKFKYKNILFVLVLATMLIPNESIIISNFLTITSLKLQDTYWGLTLPFFATATGIFILRQNYLVIPKELYEAAKVDGCNDFRFFVTILFPLSMPAVFTLAIYTFINTWNQYMWPLLVTNSASMRTVQIGISMLKYADALSFGPIMASFIIILIPSVCVFAFGQKLLIGGMTSGAIKG